MPFVVVAVKPIKTAVQMQKETVGQAKIIDMPDRARTLGKQAGQSAKKAKWHPQFYVFV